MKAIKIYTTALCSILFVHAGLSQASLTSDTIKVWGNCSMCKKVIEKAARNAGASKASWNEDTKQLVVSYPAGKITNKMIQESVAGSGYDTQDLIANDKAYNKLPGCCHYDRKAGKTLDKSLGKTYTCPMHPSVVSKKMGKCPECGMNLIEKKSGSKN